MNHAQFGLFAVYAFSVLSCGIGIYNFLDTHKKSFINKGVFIGEVFLIGSIFLIGELLILSLIRLYRAPYLWGAVLINYVFLVNKNTRNEFFGLFRKKVSFNFPKIIFMVLLSVLIFRNSYFMVDVDSHSTYLFAQRLWISSGTSLIGNVGNDCRIFVPHFNAVPYGLGISLFGKETLFPQLIDISWRVIVLFLVFGYTTYRFNGYYGLAATMFVIFNEHFFYSGANQWVILNGALIGFLFSAAYNFWESRTRNDPIRFLLALIFLSQVMANKYQMAYVLFFMLGIGILIQPGPIKRIKEILFNKRWVFALSVSVTIMLLWYIKNFLLTGDPAFPILAGKLGVFNWIPEQERVFLNIWGGVKPLVFLKYMNSFFIWPGITPAKYVIITVSFLPLIILMSTIRPKMDKVLLLELCYWLGLSVLTIMGLCLTNWQDPRGHRYPIAILSFTAVFSIHYILKSCFNIDKRIILCTAVLLFAFMGGPNDNYKIIYKASGNFKFPGFQENINVIQDKIHMDYAIKKHYPQIEAISDILSKNKEKIDRAAWDMRSFTVNIPEFLLPLRPVIDMHYSTIIKWNSYLKKELIIEDLKRHGIEWVIQIKNAKWDFVPIEMYAQEAVAFGRYPEKTFHDYGFPQELTQTH